MEKFNKIVLNVPHSSIENYSNGWEGSYKMFPLVKELTDWHTDLLFNNEKCSMVRFPYSRFYCDVERLLDDPMEKEGQGIIYTRYGALKRNVSDTERQLLMELWNSHQKYLSALIEDDKTMLIDCHSFPSSVDKTIDICIGVNDDWSKPSDELLSYVCNKFEEGGYSVVINKPYSNSITPESVYCYRSMMIEVNKRCYMDEDTLEIWDSGFTSIKRILDDIYLMLLGNGLNK